MENIKLCAYVSMAFSLIGSVIRIIGDRFASNNPQVTKVVTTFASAATVFLILAILYWIHELWTSRKKAKGKSP